VRRDKELSTDAVIGLRHREAIRTARRAIGCR
jgi:hypothetical protein